MSPYACGNITGMISPQNVLIGRMSHHVRHLHPIRGSNALESDGESSTQRAKMITISNAHGEPPEVGSPRPDTGVSDDTSANESSEEEVVLTQRNTRCKRPAPCCHICDHEIKGECSGSKRQDELATFNEAAHPC